VRSSSESVEQLFGRHGVLPVLVVEAAASAEPLARALVAGGLPLAEVTLRSAAALETVRIMAEHPDMLVGIGTAVHPSQVAPGLAAGAQFVVTPGYAPAVVRECRSLGVPVFPGVATATEIQMALDDGLNTLKFFPAALSGGPAAITALAQPYQAVRFIPTGGITARTLPDYTALEPVLAVGGSWLAPRDLLHHKRFDEITRLAAEAVSVVRTAAGPSCTHDKEA
jgi:2-dehydro-3-deoxyphosphogluconate aldolase/(4S)-4-hydroxy-2-oxoglutarate aldolase